jgi:hypothetical protein
MRIEQVDKEGYHVRSVSAEIDNERISPGSSLLRFHRALEELGRLAQQALVNVEDVGCGAHGELEDEIAGTELISLTLSTA